VAFAGAVSAMDGGGQGAKASMADAAQVVDDSYGKAGTGM
jgi:hypothetical protein